MLSKQECKMRGKKDFCVVSGIFFKKQKTMYPQLRIKKKDPHKQANQQHRLRHMSWEYGKPMQEKLP